MEDVDYLIFHQSNRFIINHLVKKIGTYTDDIDPEELEKRADLPENDSPIRETIGTKITQLKKEVEDQQGAECQGMSEEDISLFKKALSSHDDLPTLLDGAAAGRDASPGADGLSPAR